MNIQRIILTYLFRSKKSVLASFFAAMLTLAFAVPECTQAQNMRKSSIVFNNVSVVDTVSGVINKNMTVVVKGQRITQVGKVGKTKIPKSSKVIDASGKFLIPGLWDMHVHTFFGNTGKVANDITLPLFIANGVTGVRDLGSDLDKSIKAREDIKEGRFLGPRMFVSGPMLDGPKVSYSASIAITSPEDGRRAVDRLADAGVDFIKIQSGVPRDAYFAIVDQCKKRNLPFVGHVPNGVRGGEAAKAGQKSFEHLIGVFEGSSTKEEAFLKGSKGPGPFLDTYDPEKESEIIKLLAKQETWQCPTLYWERGQWLVDVVDTKLIPDVKYAPLSWRNKTWKGWSASIMKGLNTDPLSVRKRFVEHELGIVLRLQRAGVPFLAGTDTPAGVGVIPGFSLHQELERFVDAGFTPLESLQTATINPARFFNKLDDFGTITKGKIADLVLLDADPTKDITNTQKIAAVVADGHYLSRSKLDRMLKKIETSASTR